MAILVSSSLLKRETIEFIFRFVRGNYGEFAKYG